MPSETEPLDEWPEKPPPAKSTKRATKGPDEAERSVDEWAKEYFPATGKRSIHPGRWKHETANALHGWSLYVHHENKPLFVSRQTYEKAIEAACRHPLEAYPPASTKYAPVRKLPRKQD